MPFPALLAQLRYNTERLNKLPLPVHSQADRKVLRELLASTLETLHLLYIAQLAQTRSQPAQWLRSPLYQGLHQLRVLERELLLVSPGKQVPAVLWEALQQALGTVLAEVDATYRFT